MILVIPEVFSAEECHAIRERLAQASWQDGRATAGYIAVQQKSNEQLNVQDPVAIKLAQTVLQRLSSLPKFVSFALPLKILPPMFNRYQGGGAYGFHIDNAIRVHPQTGERIRTDISTTVFFSDPDSYEGGELEIQDNYGTQRVKLPAGHAVVYPGTSLHRVCPVTQGERLAAFFWTQSMVREDSARQSLYELDNVVQQLASRGDSVDEVTRLSGVYHNLIRQWGET